MGVFNYDLSGFGSVKVLIARTQVIEWVEARLRATRDWLKHKQGRLNTMLEDKKLTQAAFRQMLRNQSRGYGSSNMRGRSGERRVGAGHPAGGTDSRTRSVQGSAG